MVWKYIICGTSYFDEIFWRLPGSDTELHREPFYKKEREIKSELGLIPRKLLILFRILKTMRQPIWFVLLTSLDTDRELSATSDKRLLRVTWCWTPGYDQKQSELIVCTFLWENYKERREKEGYDNMIGAKTYNFIIKKRRIFWRHVS